MLRLWVATVAMMHWLRNAFLSGDFERKLTALLQTTSRTPSSSMVSEPTREVPQGPVASTVTITADRTQFAEQYEAMVLAFEELTPHQRQKLADCEQSTQSVHVRAAAGAGKTFVALHLMLKTLRAEPQGRVLFVAKSVALAMFIAVWVGRRAKRRSDANSLLGRLHLLAPPLEGGPRVATRSRDQLQLMPLPPLAYRQQHCPIQILLRHAEAIYG